MNRELLNAEDFNEWCNAQRQLYASWQVRNRQLRLWVVGGKRYEVVYGDNFPRHFDELDAVIAYFNQIVEGNQ